MQVNIGTDKRNWVLANDIGNGLLIENKLIICALGNFHYKISREKFEPEPGFEPRTSGLLARRSTTWAILDRNPEVRGSNPGSGSNFSLEIL